MPSKRLCQVGTSRPASDTNRAAAEAWRSADELEMSPSCSSKRIRLPRALSRRAIPGKASPVEAQKSSRCCSSCRSQSQTSKAQWQGDLLAKSARATGLLSQAKQGTSAIQEELIAGQGVGCSDIRWQVPKHVSSPWAGTVQQYHPSTLQVRQTVELLQ